MEISQRLKLNGLKVTGPRLRLLQLLMSQTNRHWRAEELHQTLCASQAEMGLATVYRILAQFEKSGLVRRHRFDGGHAVFEFAELNPHDHLVCTQCGKVEEFVDPIIEARQQLVAQRASYLLTSRALQLYGVCAFCQDI